MKYRMLTKEEMIIFDEDFKHFAVANGVSNEEWIEMNERYPEKAIQLVAVFSDVVLQKVYEKVTFIENRSKSACLVFKLNKDTIDLISLSTSSETIDLSTPETIHDALVNHPLTLSFFTFSKPYNKMREMEIHDMIENGCVNSSEEFWNSLQEVIQKEA